MNELGIYIHIPFCVKKCKYCNFPSYPNMESYQEEYIKALCSEINDAKKNYKNHIVTSVFIGGGTPSHLITGGIATILSEVKQNFTLSDDVEITIEANPNSITMEKAYEWKNSGVNRVSVGVQTCKNNLLRLIGRVHTKQDYFKAMKTLQAVGIDNINTDIMLGLPAQKQSDVKVTLKYIVKFGSTHVSAYTLILEENTPLYNEVENGKVKLPKEEKVLSMYDYAKKQLEESGFARYEVSNFAKPNKECRHNKNCWNMIDYVGFGAGAHSFVNGTRFSNFDTIPEYLNHLKDGSAIEVKEKLSSQELFEEEVMLGLRLKEGINLSKIKDKYNIDLLSTKKDIISKYIEMGFLQLIDDHLSATNDGFKILNKLILDIVY